MNCGATSLTVTLVDARAGLAFLVGHGGLDRITAGRDAGADCSDTCGCAENVSSPGRATIVASAIRRPSRSRPCWCGCRRGSRSFRSTVSEPFSSMLDDESTRPGAANAGAGSLMTSVVWANAVLPQPSVNVTPTLYREGRVGRVIVRGREGVGPGRKDQDGRGRAVAPVDRRRQRGGRVGIRERAAHDHRSYVPRRWRR